MFSQLVLDTIHDAGQFKKRSLSFSRIVRYPVRPSMIFKLTIGRRGLFQTF